MSAQIRFFCWIVALAFVIHANAQSKEQDEIKGPLPGMTFQYDHKQYSGFLNVPSNNNLFYWFLESQGNPSCSSMVGMFTELGPFYNNPNGTTLFENVYSWNKFANIIFLESPRNVGFSYGANGTYNDELTTIDSADALVEFFKRYPEYNGREFYITGESYAGVYIPLLVERMIDIILKDPAKIPVKLAGAAIGNGILSEKHQTNSFVNLAFYRGIADFDEITTLQEKCCDTKKQIYEYCDFFQYITFTDNSTIIPVKNSDPSKDICGEIVKNITDTYLFNTRGYNKYSHEQSCYAKNAQFVKNRERSFVQVVANQALTYALSDSPIISDGTRHFIDQSEQRNIFSSDQLGGFPCYNNDVLETYLNLDAVRSAIHVDGVDAIKGRKWTECADYMDGSYIRQNRDTMPVFNRIITKAKQVNPPLKLRFLIYNGDADGVCNFLGDEWFTEELVAAQRLDTVTERQQWYYKKGDFVKAPVGFYKTFGHDNFLIDLVTVSGAGHYVPTFRPQPAFQMFGNFLAGIRNYSMPVNRDTTPKPPTPDYVPDIPDEFTRAQADQVFYLPGLTFETTFDHHSGYLKGKEGNFLHYWLIKSQTYSDKDPLILWLNGGPGCSSLGGALTELGPFRPNPDGKTLSENVFAWNRGANLLFLESPRNVGFSYQNRSINNETQYSDEQTIENNYLAIKDFFEVYPEYKSREFFVMAESYGGVYGPTITRKLIQEIQNGNLPGVNLVGMAIGNGELSAIEQIKSSGPLMYHRGILDKYEWDGMLACCGGDYNQLYSCDVTRFVYLDPAGNAMPLNKSSICSNIFAGIVQRFWQYAIDSTSNPYNIYQGS